MLSILPLDVSTEGRKMPTLILCLVVLGCIQQQAHGQGNSFNPCKIRRPLRNDLNYCGRGGQECPKGYHCVIDPADRYAACCQDELPCDQGQGSKTVMCGRDRSCPPGSHCVDDPGKEYSVCCRGNPGACSQKEKDTCLESCLAQGLNAIEGAECNGCPCIHPCAAVLCFTGTVCLGVEGTCNRPICPLEPRCVPICELPIEPGRCRAYIPRWAFDADLNICREFIYGGCGGNANNFETFEACRDSCHNCPQLRCLECENGNTQDLRGCRGCGCRDTCDLPQDLGECAKGEEPVTRYWHNPETRQCERFRGCDGGNANSFTDFNDCFDTCEPCPVVDCIPGFVPCELRGLVPRKTRDGCDTCSCLDYSEVCAMAADPGPCTDYAQRFYFNPDSGSCEPFIFGGCVGNANNFATKEECEGKCNSGCTEAEKDACLESCLAQNMNSVPGEECNGCPCIDPCIAATCPIGTVCTPVPVICIDPPCTLGTECVQPCTEAEKDACLESCLAQNMNSVPGEECNGCPCFDPCIAATCLIGTVCTPVPVLCIDPPCTLGVECVPICELPIEMGPCEAAIKRWAFDADLNICREFIYGGCGGNANNFETFEACRDSCHNCPRLLCPECLNGNTKDLRGCRDCGCTETCDLPQDLGECAEGEEPVTRYWHNPESRLCDRYEGCDGGNANSFIDAVDCFETCNVCPQILCTPDFVPCALRGLVPKKTEEGCDTCQCIDYSEVCAMAADPGPCTDYAQRFYFNPDSGSCEPFIFGGCVGNANNFATKEECEGKCNNPCTLEQMDACLESCLAQNMNAVLGEECNGCPCIDPCIAATCPEGTICLSVPLQCFRAPCPLGVDCVPVLVPN